MNSEKIENKKVFSLNEYGNSIYISSSGNVIDQTSMDERIEKIYAARLTDEYLTVLNEAISK